MNLRWGRKHSKMPTGAEMAATSAYSHESNIARPFDFPREAKYHHFDMKAYDF